MCASGPVGKEDQGVSAMTMRKLMRRRTVFRELLQNLEVRPFCEDAPLGPSAWMNQPRPRLAYAPRPAAARGDDYRR